MLLIYICKYFMFMQSAGMGIELTGAQEEAIGY
jgi:hypothetical protein